MKRAQGARRSGAGRGRGGLAGAGLAARLRAGVALVAAPLAVALGATEAHAQELSPEVTDRCVRATVKVVALMDNSDSGSTGTGSMIDPRGYVLTNFHVVGRVQPDAQGPAGSLYNRANRVQLAMVDDARQVARPRYVGMVVRGDPALDLALIRVVADVDGNPVGAQPFPTVPTATTRHLRPGARLFAFGFPLSMRTINVTGGSLTGFQLNGRDEVSWLRTDARFNHGNSGGMLVDGEGRLVAVPTAVVHSRRGERLLEPIELARPVERVPSEWVEALRRGHITDVALSAPPRLHVGQTVNDTAVGDSVTLDGTAELHYYPAPLERPSQVTATPALGLALATPQGRILREGQGTLAVQADDPRDAVVIALVPNAQERPTAFALSVAPAVGLGGAPAPGVLPAVVIQTDGPPAVFGAAAPPAGPAPVPVEAAPPPAPPPVDPPAGGGDNGSVTPGAGAPTEGFVVPPAAGVDGASAVRLRSAVLDALTGRPVPGAMVLVGRPGTDLAANLSAFLAGRVTEPQFRSTLAGASRTDAAGRIEIAALARGQVYPVVAAASGYRPARAQLTIAPTERALLELPALRLTR